MFRVYCAPDGSPAEYSEENVPYKPKHFLPVSLGGLVVNNLNFYSFDGRMNSTLSYRMDKNRNLACKGTVSGININKLFDAFGNFGQTYITTSNIEGTLAATFTLLLPFNGDKPDTDKMDFDGHLEITDGKLHNVEATNSIADFTKIDEFRNLEFCC